MTKRFLQNITRWASFAVVLYLGLLRPVQSVNVRHPPKNPSTIEAQAKFFQDFFSVQLSPYKIEFGHVCEDPNTWEQRYESNDYKSNRAMGKVRWGDKKGGYGEHYWDLNHAGPSHDNNGYDNSDDGSYHPDPSSDDGSYNEESINDAFDEPSEPSPSYDNGDYDPETAAKYDNGRAKRAHTRNYEKKTAERDHEKPERQTHRKIKTTETVQESDKKKLAKRRQRQKVDREYEDYQPTEKSRYEVSSNKDQPTASEKSRFVVNYDEDVTKTADYTRPEPRYVPYENGAGVRQHHQPEVSASVLAPRLFLEASTGHVVDRATGRSYVLQPVLNVT